MQTRFEDEPLGRDQFEFVAGDDLARALADADVANAVLPRIAPVGIKTWIGVVCRQIFGQGLAHVADFQLRKRLRLAANQVADF